MPPWLISSEPGLSAWLQWRQSLQVSRLSLVDHTLRSLAVTYQLLPAVYVILSELPVQELGLPALMAFGLCKILGNTGEQFLPMA